MGSDWRDQISSIIADTNRNLGGRGLSTIATVPPMAYRTARPAEFESVFHSGGSSASAAFTSAGYGGSKLPVSPTAAAHHAYQAHQATNQAGRQSPQQASLDALMSEGPNLSMQVGNFQSSMQRILESVKFELDVRGSVAQKHGARSNAALLAVPEPGCYASSGHTRRV